MIRIIVQSAETVERSGVSKTSGKPYHMASQIAWFHLTDRNGQPQPYPQRVELMLDKDPQTGAFKPYPVGEYTLDPSSLYVDRLGGLRVSPRLVPARTAHAARTAAAA